MTARRWLGRHPGAAVLAVVVAIVLAFVAIGALGSQPSGATPPPSAAGTGATADREPGSRPSPSGTTSPQATAPDPVPEPTPPPSPTPPPDDEAAADGTALAAVALLEVKGRAPRTGYDRDLFGDGWVDVDRNGCDTRNDVLARDLTGETFRAGTRDCVVLTGTLADPYSGATIAFQRGQGTSELVQIDHVVALADAWQKGAQQWDETTRVAFANDPLNLLAVDGPLNQQKGAGDAATWLPPNRGYRCPYVARQVAVKATYGVWVTAAERDAMVRVLSECPDEPLPDGAAAGAVGPVTGAPQPAPAEPAPAPAPVPAPAPDPVPAPAGCDPSYPGICIPPGVADLDCGDIPERRFVVLPPDPHRFDGNADGVGCEG